MEGSPERVRDLPKATQLVQDAALAPTALLEHRGPLYEGACVGGRVRGLAASKGTLPPNTKCIDFPLHGLLFKPGKCHPTNSAHPFDQDLS